MKKIISTVATSLFLGTATTAATASAVFSYGFSVTSYDCFLPGCVEEDYFRGKLESMTLNLTQQAVTDGQAKLHYTTKDWGSNIPWTSNVTNQGFSSVGLDAWNVSLDFDQGICKSLWICNVEAALSVAGLLTGLFKLDTNHDNVHMSSSGSNTWSGYIYSDGPFMTSSPGHFPTFTGEWQLQKVVPEPGQWLLFLTALAALGLMRRGKSRG
ncbi:MAG: PEP-CTERM sorting domain-containing protein [Proteobacteria bacterium]|nr:PEP-CTERM sorting domain-containing protein [Pseudomonadota bacterium]